MLAETRCRAARPAHGGGGRGTGARPRRRRPGTTSSAGRPTTASPRSTVGPRAVGPTTPPTSSSPPAPPGAPKGVVQTHGRTLRVATDWVAMTGLTAGDRYLMVNPYFHMFGLKAGILASVAAGATMLPEPVFDPDRVLARVAAEGVTVLPGRADALPVAPRPPRPRPLTTCRACGVAVTGAADIPVELIRRIVDELPFPTIITGYGLTEGGTAAATAPGDDVETIATTVGRPRPGFELRIVDGEADTTWPRARPARSCSAAAASCRTTSTTPTPPPRRCRPTAGSAPGDLGAARRRRVPAHRRALQGHVHRRRLQRLSGRDRERPAAPPRRSSRPPSSASPTSASARSGMAFVVLRPGADGDRRRRSSRGAASRWPTTRCPGSSRSSTSSR